MACSFFYGLQLFYSLQPWRPAFLLAHAQSVRHGFFCGPFPAFLLSGARSPWGPVSGSPQRVSRGLLRRIAFCASAASCCARARFATSPERAFVRLGTGVDRLFRRLFPAESSPARDCRRAHASVRSHSIFRACAHCAGPVIFRDQISRARCGPKALRIGPRLTMRPSLDFLSALSYARRLARRPGPRRKRFRIAHRTPPR